MIERGRYRSSAAIHGRFIYLLLYWRIWISTCCLFRFVLDGSHHEDDKFSILLTI
ncbi:unnamed protein product [Amoebophrya sp. A120]|nr:unnamed protein product [Amoebophrya sp. A120]|eukprot:GSA120T00022374001.1